MPERDPKVLPVVPALSHPPAPPDSARPPSRVKMRTNWLADHLTSRDWEILASLYRLNSASITQIYRLHFVGLSLRNCQYVMRRLLDWGAVTAYERRMGGPIRGSGQRVFSLDPAAVRLMRITEGRKDVENPPEANSGRWSHRHAITVSELFVRCVEAVRNGSLDLIDFAIEPACWWPDGNGGQLKPDAYAVIGVPHTTRRQHWWIEVDLGTEDNSIVRAKFATYMQFRTRRAAGPDGTLPRVLVTVLDQPRVASLKRVVAHLGDPDGQFMHITPFQAAVPLLSAYADASLPIPNERTNP